MKRKILTIVLAAAALFALYNVLWFAWSHFTYGAFSDGMEVTDFSNFLTPHYIDTDTDRYDYLVKYPDYLSFTGNLSVGLPSTDENFFTDALILWPKAGGKYEYGVLLYDEDGSGYSVYIDSEGNALSKADEEVVSRHRENIRDLLIKADERWGIHD
jgi:hypothetical protein